MSPSRPVRAVAALVFTLTPLLAAAGQSVAVSPFVSYARTAGDPLAGFALTFGGTTGLALRSSAEMSVANERLDSAAAQSRSVRPWGADADAMLFLGGLGGGATVFSRALSPYVFAGIGLGGADSSGRNVVSHNWSYGAGAAIPLGLNAGIFAEARWRMNEYVLPTSDGAPDSRRSMRFGLSFHVGGGSGASAPRRRGRRLAEEAADDDVYVIAPEAARQPVVVVQPAPAAQPEVIVVEQEPAPQPDPIVIEREPATTTTATAPEPVWRRRAPTRRAPETVTTAPSRPVLGGIGRARGTTRVIQRRSTRTTVQQQTTVERGGIVRRPSASSAGATKVVPRSRARVQSSAQAQAKTETKPSESGSRARRGTTVRSSRTPRE